MYVPFCFLLRDMPVVSVEVHTFYAKCLSAQITVIQLPHLLDFKLPDNRETLTSVNSHKTPCDQSVNAW